MFVRRERIGDHEAVARIHAAAFALPDPPVATPVEVALVEALRASRCWIPELSLVLEVEDAVVGHVVCSRGWVGDTPALGLGPIGVVPRLQRGGGGSAMMHAVIGAAEAMGEPLIALLGSPAYYSRFGFVAAMPLDIAAPDPAWGEYFQVRTLASYEPSMVGPFRYAPPFNEV